MYETVWGDWEIFEFLLRTFTLMSIWEMQVVCIEWWESNDSNQRKQ